MEIWVLTESQKITYSENGRWYNLLQHLQFSAKPGEKEAVNKRLDHAATVITVPIIVHKIFIISVNIAWVYCLYSMVQKQYAAQKLFLKISYSTYRKIIIEKSKWNSARMCGLLSILVFRYTITKAHRVQNDQNIFMENWYTRSTLWSIISRMSSLPLKYDF